MHLDPAIDALGPFVRLLRAGIFVRQRTVTEEEALSGAADFCLFRPSKHTVEIPTFIDGWRVTASEWDASRIVWRTPRTHFTGVCLTKQLLSSIFDHGSCAQHGTTRPRSPAGLAACASRGRRSPTSRC